MLSVDVEPKLEVHDELSLVKPAAKKEDEIALVVYCHFGE